MTMQCAPSWHQHEGYVVRDTSHALNTRLQAHFSYRLDAVHPHLAKEVGKRSLYKSLRCGSALLFVSRSDFDCAKGRCSN